MGDRPPNRRSALNDRNAARIPMVIRIAIDTLDPLSGTARNERGEELRFEGWLGLLSALSTMAGSTGDTSAGDEEVP